MAEHQQVSKTRILALDGLRGLGIIFLVGYIFFQHLFPGGFVLTNYFFFITGILVFRKFHRKIVINESLNYCHFVIQYVERLFFPILLTVTLSTMLAYFISKDQYVNLKGMAFSSLLMVNNLYQWFAGHTFTNQTSTSTMFSHLWYFSMLGQFILLTPLLIEVTYKWHKRVSIAVNMLGIISIISMVLSAYLIATGWTNASVYFNPLARLSAYTLGGMFGLLMPLKWAPSEINQSLARGFNFASIIIGLFLFAILAFMYGNGSFAIQFGLSIVNLILIPLMMIGLRPGTWLNRFLTWNFLVHLGRKAYAYYLWSLPIFLLLPYLLSGLNQYYSLYQFVSLVILVIFANLTDILFGEGSIQLPFGQDFNFKDTPQRLRHLLNENGNFLKEKFASIVYLLLVLLGFFALLMSPQVESAKVQTSKAIMQTNASIIQQTQQADRNKNIVINNIQGLPQEVKLFANAMDITFIGDSIFLVAAPQLLEVFPKAVIDADQSRQLYNSISHIKELENKGLLKENVVVLLGTNSSFTKSQLNDLIETLGSNREIYFVLVGANRAWSDNANQKFIEAARQFANVKTIDWSSYRGANPSKFIDGIHPDQEASLELAKSIAEQLYRDR